MLDLQQLLSPFVSRPLNAEELRQFQLYLDLLLKWNARINLTSVREPAEIVVRHFGESLFAAEQLDIATESTLIDFGSGAGFPGLPIKIFAPPLPVTLLESHQKKAAFLREVVRALGLENVTVHAARAENSSLSAQIVTMRAVEQFEMSLPVAASLVESGGKLTLLIGVAQQQTATNDLPQFEWREAIPIPNSRSRVVFIGKHRRLLD